MLLVIPAVFNSNDISAQTVTVKVGTEKEEKKKEDLKEKSEVKPVQSSSPTLEQELKKVFGMKSETTIGGSRIENLGKYFLDKYTGQVTLVTYQRGEPVRWNILRDIGAGLRNIFGGRSGSYEQELLNARTSALRELENRARERGADAVVGIDIDYEVLGPNGGMLMVTASGTAVKLG